MKTRVTNSIPLYFANVLNNNATPPLAVTKAIEDFKDRIILKANTSTSLSM